MLAEGRQLSKSERFFAALNPKWMKFANHFVRNDTLDGDNFFLHIQVGVVIIVLKVSQVCKLSSKHAYGPQGLCRNNRSCLSDLLLWHSLLFWHTQHPQQLVVMRVLASRMQECIKARTSPATSFLHPWTSWSLLSGIGSMIWLAQFPGQLLLLQPKVQPLHAPALEQSS